MSISDWMSDVCSSDLAEMEIPLGSGAREMGLRPSIFADVGAVAGWRNPRTTDSNGICADNTTGSRSEAGTPGTCGTGQTLLIGPFEEEYLGDTLKPRVAVGFGVTWNSPFGPFRLHIAKALLKEIGKAPCLLRVCLHGEIAVVAASLKKKNHK